MTGQPEPQRGDWRDEWRRRWASDDDGEGVRSVEFRGPPSFGRWWPAARFPWLGLVLVVLGVGLLVRQLIPGVSFAGLLLLAMGLGFAAAWFFTRGRWAVPPALLLLALAVARLLTDVQLLRGEGWSALLLGAAVLGVWLVSTRRDRRSWLLWAGAILVVVGVVQLSPLLPGVPNFSQVWPLVLVGAGVVLIAVNARRAQRVR